MQLWDTGEFDGLVLHGLSPFPGAFAPGAPLEFVGAALPLAKFAWARSDVELLAKPSC